MKKFFALMIVLALAGGAFAQASDSHTASMVVPAVNTLTLSNTGGTVSMTLVDNGTTGLAVSGVNGGTMDYRHNSKNSVTITATAGAVSAGGTGSPATLDLFVEVAGGGEKQIVSGGTPAAAQTVVSPAARGRTTGQSITYRAFADYDTDADTYSCTVTYTLVGM